MNYILAIIASYLLGSINSAIIVTKSLKNTDIRTLGSGNAGMTNVLRNFGKGLAALVILGDALKGIIAVLIGRLLIGGDLGAILAGFAVILGHNWPIFFGFKGGKGILTSAIVILMITPKIGLIVMAISITVMIVTGFVSLGSIIGCIMYPIAVLITDLHNVYLVLFAFIISILAIYRHRANIKRLMNGTESKFSRKRI